ncbi:hypothetical protein JKP88DRAFT_253792 [Tribonema minus]|uniref:Uncharacterized protein n=1 Tax=Tribonema minus TaxID=303371 RepID=A0A835Z6V5_9STRA|nr:hypothetical protein JKP88DRAFT_253792 [Tribonema minus]
MHPLLPSLSGGAAAPLLLRTVRMARRPLPSGGAAAALPPCTSRTPPSPSFNIATAPSPLPRPLRPLFPRPWLPPPLLPPNRPRGHRHRSQYGSSAALGFSKYFAKYSTSNPNPKGCKTCDEAPNACTADELHIMLICEAHMTARSRASTAINAAEDLSAAAAVPPPLPSAAAVTLSSTGSASSAAAACRGGCRRAPPPSTTPPRASAPTACACFSTSGGGGGGNSGGGRSSRCAASTPFPEASRRSARRSCAAPWQCLAAQNGNGSGGGELTAEAQQQQQQQQKLYALDAELGVGAKVAEETVLRNRAATSTLRETALEAAEPLPRATQRVVAGGRNNSFFEGGAGATAAIAFAASGAAALSHCASGAAHSSSSSIDGSSAAPINAGAQALRRSEKA